MYGLNNNTGTTYSNSNNNYDKIKKNITQAAGYTKTAFDGLNAIKNFQNAKTASEKIQAMSSIAAMMG